MAQPLGQAAHRILHHRNMDRHHACLALFRAGFRVGLFDKPGAKTAVERVALDDLHGQPKVVAALHLRTIGQHKIGGQECADNCVYLFPGLQYQLRVTMFRNGAPKISVPVGVVTVDDDGVTVRQQQRS